MSTIPTPMTFHHWWVNLSKVDYMTKEEVAYMAWNHSAHEQAKEIRAIRAALASLLAEGKPEYCSRAEECFQDDQAGWLAYDDPESNACGGCWFSLCACASEAQTAAAELLMKGGAR